MSNNIFSRRQVLGGVGAALAGTAYAQAPGAKPAAPAAAGTAKPAAPAAPPRPRLTIDSGPRIAPVGEIVLIREFEDNARLKLPPAVFSTIAGTDHRASDRMTLHPRMFFPTMDMDLTVELFGDKHFTPILVGAWPEQKRYHPDAELATVRGAGAGRAGVVISSQSSVPIEQIMVEAKTPIWVQVAVGPGAQAAVARAAKAGVRAIVVTQAAEPDWAAIDGLRKGLNIPLVVKGVTTAAGAKAAVQNGAQGIIVCDTANTSTPLLTLAGIADAVAGKVPVLYQGSVRGGADVYKALAFGARAVLVGRPAVWALAAYGAIGVQTMVELMQGSELARTMVMMGASTPAKAERKAVRIHATATT
jgi:4-hydroxymandelate oxidase